MIFLKFCDGVDVGDCVEVDCIFYIECFFFIDFLVS